MNSIIDEYRKHEVFMYRGINLAKVISTRTYNVSIYKYIKEIVRMLFFSYIKNYKNNGGNMIFFYSHREEGRDDYDKIADEFCSIVKRKDVFEYYYKLSPRKINQKISFLIYFYLLYKKNKIETPFFLSLLTAQYIVYYDEISRVFEKKCFKVGISFSDFIGIENLAVQIAKKNNVVTGTLQHGQYRFLKSENENEDAEAYKNFTSDYLLAWGEATKNEFEKFGINPKRILCVGSLKYKKRVFCNNKKKKKVFGVVLSGNSYHETNLKLIEIANEIAIMHKLKYILRLHPKNKSVYYKNKCDKNYLLSIEQGIDAEEYVKKIDFTILHMTSVIIELLKFNSIVYIFNDNKLEDLFKIEKYCFKNIDEFCCKYRKYSLQLNDLKKEQYKYFSYFNKGGNVKKNYVLAIRKMYKDYNDNKCFSLRERTCL